MFVLCRVWKKTKKKNTGGSRFSLFDQSRDKSHITQGLLREESFRISCNKDEIVAFLRLLFFFCEVVVYASLLAPPPPIQLLFLSAARNETALRSTSIHQIPAH